MGLYSTRDKCLSWVTAVYYTGLCTTTMVRPEPVSFFGTGYTVSVKLDSSKEWLTVSTAFLRSRNTTALMLPCSIFNDQL